jgi:large conductance mechanosensitive channel
MISEFKSFLLTTNALALAIGVIIGGALGTVVSSLVDDIIMPPSGWLSAASTSVRSRSS